MGRFTVRLSIGDIPRVQVQTSSEVALFTNGVVISV